MRLCENFSVQIVVEIVRAPERLGFVEVRQRGSPEHSVIQTGAPTTVPVHVGRDISPILLRQICRYMTVSTDDFLAA